MLDLRLRGDDSNRVNPKKYKILLAAKTESSGGFSFLFFNATILYMRLTITPQQYEKIRDLAERYKLSLVVLFGSQATGKTHSESDVDIAYLSASPLDLMEEGRLSVDLMPVVRSPVVDVVDIRHAPPLLAKRIFDHHQILFCRDYGEYFSYLMYAMRRYQEAAPLFMLKELALARFLRTHDR